MNNIVWTVVIGFVVGLVARALKPGRDSMGIIWTTLLGIAGAVLARLVGDQLHWHASNALMGFAASVVGAIVLLVLVDAVRGRRR